LFYLDFALGLILASVVFAFTVGNLGFDGFNFLDDLQHAGKRQWMYVFIAGLIFNLGNMLLMAAVSVSGLAVAFPMGMGMALLLGTVMGIASRPAGNSLLLGMGCLLILTSIIVNAISYRIMGVAKHEELARAGRAKSTRRPNPLKGIILALAAGILIGGFVPLLDKARQGDLGLGPYAAGFIFAFGVFFSTFVYEIFFMNLPVEGEPVEFGEYFNGRLGQHLAGLTSGFIWFTGLLAALVATSVPEAMQGGSMLRYLLAQGSPVLAALWGILVFREFKNGDIRVKLLGTLMLVLFLCGMAMIGLAPALLRKE
jgi:glucose uptake protein